MTAPQEFMEHYRTAFLQADRSALLDCFAFPLPVLSVADDRASTSVATGPEWRGVLDRLLRVYERLGVTDCEPLTIEIIEPMAAVRVVAVHWALLGEDRALIYDFTAVYTLVHNEQQLQIVAIAHDESPKMQAALSGLLTPAEAPGNTQQL